MKTTQPNPPPAPKVKATLNEFLECVPLEWRDAPIAIAIEKSGYVEQGDYRLARVVLTIDRDGRRCVIFSRYSTNIV